MGKQENIEKRLKNLKSFKDMDRESAAKIQSAGGKACQKMLKKQKDMKTALLALLECNPTAEMIANCEVELGLTPTSLQDVINCKMITKATEGDIKAAEFVRDTTGQKPKDRIEQDINTFTPIKIEFVE